MRRVIVVGSGGAGKSTLAVRIGARLQLPVIHLDARHWHAGWRSAPPEVWRREVEALVAAPAWVMDGNYAGTLDVRMAACDTVVFLDLPRLICLWRVMVRTLRYRGRTRPDMAPGCPERWDWEFLRWVWSFPRRHRPAVLRRLAARPADTRLVHLRSRRAVERWLASLPPATR